MALLAPGTGPVGAFEAAAVAEYGGEPLRRAVVAAEAKPADAEDDASLNEWLTL